VQGQAISVEGVVWCPKQVAAAAPAARSRKTPSWMRRLLPPLLLRPPSPRRMPGASSGLSGAADCCLHICQPWQQMWTVPGELSGLVAVRCVIPMFSLVRWTCASIARMTQQVAFCEGLDLNMSTSKGSSVFRLDACSSACRPAEQRGGQRKKKGKGKRKK
jgi:hypothetical protein